MPPFHGVELAARAQNNSQTQAIFRAFQPDDHSSFTSWSVIVSIQSDTTTSTVWIEISTLICSYSLLEIYLTFFKGAPLRLFLLFIKSFSIVKYNKSKCNCCARCARVHMVKLILRIARDLDSVALANGANDRLTYELFGHHGHSF